MALSTLTVTDLIEQLQMVKDHYGGELPVVTDQEASVVGVEYNDTEGTPAIVLAIDAE